jgi:hypothetical protein
VDNSLSSCYTHCIYEAIFEQQMTIDDIKKMLDSGMIAPTDEDIVERGQMASPKGGHVEYQLHHGWDPAKAHVCDKTWGVFNVELMRFIKCQAYDDGQLRAVLDQIQIDDSHWNWLTKSLFHKSAEYDWFFLMAEGYPQGACLIYHPKPSAIASGDIFYIEYVAAAPWNRDNPMSGRTFKGIATILLRYATNYARRELKLRFGFSLHALPKAIAFYRGIGMVEHPPGNKDNLSYFEMPEVSASKFAGAA